MKLFRFLSIALLLTLVPAVAFAASGGARVRAILIVASNEKGDPDPKLASYEANLKRLLRFESFRAVAEGTAAVPASGAASLALARDHRIELTRDGDAIRATWFQGTRKVIALTLPPGRPSILGGPPWDDKGGVCAVILIPE